MKWSLPLSFFLLLFAAVITVACGSNPVKHAVQSLAITPPTADARNFPDGQVQFEAAAYYDSQPSPVTGVQATWGACYQDAPTTAITVSPNGLAQCATGSSGTYNIWAFVTTSAPACPNYVTACGAGGCQITGTAKLTCP